MHTPTLKYTLSALIASLAIAGCAGKTPILDEHFGEAVNRAKAQQIINPDASLNNNPVAGIDGQAADDAIHQYHQSFARPPANTNVFNIGIGSSGGSSGASSNSMSGAK